MMADSAMDDAFELLTLASQLEKEKGSRIEAATKYYEAIYLMKLYMQRLPATSEEEATRRLVQDNIRKYERKASTLMADDQSTTKLLNSPRSPTMEQQSFVQDNASVIPMPVPADPSPRAATSDQINSKVSQANNKLAHALDLDESKQKAAAIQAYTEAAQTYLEALQTLQKENTPDESVADQLKRFLEQTLDRIEELKNPKAVLSERRVQEPARNKTPLKPSPSSLSSGSLTPEEIAVLKKSSLISSGVFLPWSDDDVKKLTAEALDPKSLYTDPDGFLPLSDKQVARFVRWARPSEIVQTRHQLGRTRKLQKPVMVKCISPYTIKQQCVTDCSFIASLCCCAAFERRFKKQLITSIVYPQTEQGNLLYNPAGKYMVKLWLNGVARCVVVDDYLPIDEYGNLLCSHSTSTKDSQLELWVCLIEKAYMKLCGGYNFPGSNSGVDLFSLTGWIPERILFAKDINKVRDYETTPERAWERIVSASSYGDCLITVSTNSDMTEDEAESIGLVTGHAYAVLSIIQTKNGTRLLQLKNPWAHKSWKGRYSSGDRTGWRDPAFCAEVGYNPTLAAKQDDGIFWICWEDILRYFQNFHLSWNPFLFRYRVSTHAFWPRDQGPVDDTFNVGDNPQYLMHLSQKAIKNKAKIWILISRHVTKQEQEGSEVKDFLTVHLHHNTGKKERIWYPGKSGNCVLTGAYTNNPHVLIRYDVKDPADEHLSLVLSQYKKSNDLSFTLSCFCTEPFTLDQPRQDLAHKFAVSASLSKTGGPVGSRKFGGNTMFAVSVPRSGSFVQLKISSPRSVALNALLIPVKSFGRGVEHATGEPAIDSGKYRHGFIATGREKVGAGDYVLVVSSYHPGQEAVFHLEVCSSVQLRVEQIQ